MIQRYLKAVAKVGTFILAGAITFFSLMPHPPEPLTFDGVDKLEHASAYVLLSLLALSAYVTGFKPKAMLLVGIICVCLGVAIEFIQPYTGRHFDPSDMAANAIGVAVACGLWASMKAISKNRKPSFQKP